jgi:hypothetical protein
MLPSYHSQKVRFTFGVKAEPFLFGTERMAFNTKNGTETPEMITPRSVPRHNYSSINRERKRRDTNQRQECGIKSG